MSECPTPALLVLLSGILFCPTQPVSAANFWLSTSNDVTLGSQPPIGFMDIPQIECGTDVIGSFYVWAKPDQGKTLLNWSLNVVSSNPGVLRLLSADVSAFNPILNTQTSARRWEYTGEPNFSLEMSGVESLERVMGFSFRLEPTNNGVGIGAGLTDPFAANDSWLIAEIDYITSNNEGSAEVFLQIGEAGINHLDEESADTNVVLGALSDEPIDAGSLDERQHNSETPELVVTVSDIMENSGDFDSDGDIDGRDFLRWQRGQSPNPLSTSDLATWQANYGVASSLAKTQAVPEPTSGLLVWSAVALGIGTMRPRTIQCS